MLEFQKAIQSYIEFCRSEASFTERSIERYHYILSVYSDFLLNERKLNDTSIFSYLRGLTYEEILSSLDFYIEKYIAKAEDTVLFYISVIKEFLKYLVQCKIIDNSNIIVSFGRSDKDKDAFNYHCIKHMSTLISKGIIRKSSDGTPLNEEQIKCVIEHCNKNLSVLDAITSNINKDDYNKCVNALITKIVILTGVSVADRIFDIPLKCVNIEYGYIIVNQYPVYLSFNLRNQFAAFLSKVYRGDINNPEGLLFTQYDGSKIEQPNVIGNFISYVLNHLEIRPVGLKPASTICLAKYAIIQLIDLGIDRDTIISFTGYKDTVISSCKNYADADKEAENRKQVSNALKSLPLFDTL